jgi:WhiB family redox-sensing transcriptional regulator
LSDHAETGWRAAGACAAVDPDLFFPSSPTGFGAAQLEQARRLCRDCPVQRQCLAEAMKMGDVEGIWAGTTQAERKRARRARARSRAPEASSPSRAA